MRSVMASLASSEIDTATVNTEDETTVTTTANTTASEELPVDASERTSMRAMVEEVRAKFLQECDSNPDLYDATDIELIRQNDWQVERFIRRKKTVDESLKMLIGTLRWRHKMDMPRTKDTDFPEEFFKIGSMFGFEPDLEGNGVIFFRVRLHRKVKEMEKFVKMFMMHIINKVDMERGGQGLTVVFDCGGAGLTNLDMDIVWFLVDSLIKYYPYGMKNILVYELPWMLTHAWTIIKSWMPEEFRDKVKFVNKKNITDYIATENLPFYIGGVCKRNYHQVPKGCRPSEEVAPEQGLNEKEVKKMLKVFRPLLDEADEEIQVINSEMVAH